MGILFRLSFLLLLVAPAQGADSSLKLGILHADLSMQGLVSKELGADVHVAATPQELEDELAHGEINAAVLPPFVAVKAEKNASILLSSKLPNGALRYGAILVRGEKKAPKTVRDLRGKTMGWITRASASGHIIPKAALAEHNLEHLALKKELFLGSEAKALAGLRSGLVDAVAVPATDAKGNGPWKSFLKKGDNFKVLFVSPEIPGDALVVSKNFADRDWVDNFLKFSHSEQGKFLFGGKRFAKSGKKDYELVRDAWDLVQEHEDY